MNKNVRILDALDMGQVIDLEELETQEFIPAIGGMLIIKILHECISPIACTQDKCHELADFCIMSISNNGCDEDMLCWVCQEHKEDLVKLVSLEIPVRMYH